MTSFPSGPIKYTLAPQGGMRYASQINSNCNSFDTSAYNTIIGLYQNNSQGQCVSHLDLRTGEPVKNLLYQPHTEYACMLCINIDNQQSGGKSKYNLIGPSEHAKGIACCKCRYSKFSSGQSYGKYNCP